MTLRVGVAQATPRMLDLSGSLDVACRSDHGRGAAGRVAPGLPGGLAFRIPPLGATRARSGGGTTPPRRGSTPGSCGTASRFRPRRWRA